jgi:multiple sugar transport system substrate-binding protein
MVNGDPLETQAFQDVADAFEAANPGLTVNLITVALGEEAYHGRLALELAGDAPPDVVLIDYDAVANYFNRGALLSVSDELAQSGLIDSADFYPQALSAFQWQGEQMCLPLSISSLVVYYNQDLFDEAGLAYPEAGWTWDEFLADAQALTTGEGEEEGQFGVFIEPELNNVLPFVWSNGGEVLSADGRHLALNSPEATEAIQFVVDWQSRYHIAPSEEHEESEEAGGRFENGRLGMYIGSRGATPGFRAITAFDWDVAPLPEKEQPADVLKSDGLCLPAAAAHPDLGWKLIEFASSAAGQTIMAAAGRIVPTNMTVAQSPAFLDPAARPHNSQVWLDEIPYLHVVPPIPDWPELEELANEEIEHAYFDTGDAERAIEEIMERGERFLE